MASLLKRVLKALYSTQKRIFIHLVILFVKIIRPNLVINYDANKIRDGAGAQLHRILSLSLVSFLFDLRMIQPRIEDITIHPLDPIQDPTSLERYLSDWNTRLFSSRKFIQQPRETLSYKALCIDSLNLRSLFVLSIKSKFSKQSIILHAKESHSISDYCVDNYRAAIHFYFKEFLTFLNSRHNSSELIVHYRQGSGGFMIHPGQRIPRQMSIESVINVIENISSKSMARIVRIRLFTDSPRETFRYIPIQSQLHLWKDMPGFDGKTVINESSGVEKHLFPIAERKNLLFAVDREIDAFQMITAMARAEILIVSRSSLSYVGGLFNSCGVVFYPNGFWHTKLKGWRTYR